ncbi:hypothetical protein GQ600_9100 [Phytophthora cactorum]|nr:hypothetical protein GQ600_9100 [Phytophthora cactorum]
MDNRRCMEACIPPYFIIMERYRDTSSASSLTARFRDQYALHCRAGPLQAIGENTVVDLSADDGLDAIVGSSRCGLPSTTLGSPSPKKQSKKKKKKRPRESTALLSEKKRKQQLDTLLNELDIQGADSQSHSTVDAMHHNSDSYLLLWPNSAGKNALENLRGGFWWRLGERHPKLVTTVVSSNAVVHGWTCIVAATPCSVDDPEGSAYEYESESDNSDPQNRRMSAFTTPIDRRRAGAVPKMSCVQPVREKPSIQFEVPPSFPTPTVVAPFETSLESTSNRLRLDSERVVDLSRPEQLSAKSRGEATSKLKSSGQGGTAVTTAQSLLS